MCEHSKKPKMFCLTQGCSHALPFACIDCLKNHHKAGLRETIITEEDLLALLKIYQMPSSIKEQRKGPIYRLYQMLTTCKNELSDQLDRYFGCILNKLKYPFLYHQNILEAYRMVRDKNYHRMEHSELLSFYKTSKQMTNQSFVAKQNLFYEQYVKQTHQSLTQLTSRLQQLEEILQFKISEKTSMLHQDVANEFAALAKQIFPTQSISTPTKAKDQKKQELKKIKQVKSDLKPPAILKTLNSNYQSFMTPRKLESDIEVNMTKSPSIVVSQHSSVPKLGQTANKNQKLDSVTSLYQSTLDKSLRPIDKNTKKSQRERSSSYIQPGRIPFNQKMQSSQGYSYDASQVENIFIKITEAKPAAMNMESSIESAHDQKNKNCSTNSTITQTLKLQSKDQIRSKQQNVAKRIADLMKDQSSFRQKTQESILNDSKIQEDFHDLQDGAISNANPKQVLRQSHFLTVNNRRRVSQEDSLGKDILSFSRDEKSKVISRSIKKEIPLPEAPAAKIEPTLKPAEPTTQDKQLEMAAIFLSGINQPSNQNKICFLQKYLVKYQTNLTAIEYLSFLYLEQGKPKQCLQLCSSFIERLGGCRDDKALYKLAINYGAALNQLGRYSQAIKLMEEKLRQSQNDHMHKVIADSYFSIGVMDKAVYHYERATKMNAKFDEAYYNLAVILYQQDSFFNAKMNIDKALKLNGNSNYLELKQHIQERIQMSYQ